MDDIDNAIEAALDRVDEMDAQANEPVTNTGEGKGVDSLTEDIVATRQKAERDGQETRTGRQRDNSGKFAPKGKATPKIEGVDANTDLSDQDANVGQGEPDQEGVVGDESAATPAIEFPVYWSAELKTAVAKAPPEAQKAFLDFDAQRTEWANRTANDAERGKGIEKRFNEVLAPHQDDLKLNMVKDPFDAVERLLGWNEIFKKNPIIAIKDLMAKNNIPYIDLHEDGIAEPDLDPRVAEAIKQANEAKAQADAITNDIKTRETTARTNRVESFKDGTDSTGVQRRRFVEMYEPQIAAAVQQIRQAKPDFSEDELLHHAYEYTLQEARGAFGVTGTPAPQAKPAQQGQAPQSNKKAIAAAGSVSGAPKNGAAANRQVLKGKNFSEKIDAAMDNVSEATGGLL